MRNTLQGLLGILDALLDADGSPVDFTRARQFAESAGSLQPSPSLAAQRPLVVRKLSRAVSVLTQRETAARAAAGAAAAGAPGSMRGHVLQTSRACCILDGCLSLADLCSVPPELAVRLSKVALMTLLGSGRINLHAVRAALAAGAAGDARQQLWDSQLAATEVCIQAGLMTLALNLLPEQPAAAAAAAAAQERAGAAAVCDPREFVAWLGAATDVLLASHDPPSAHALIEHANVCNKLLGSPKEGAGGHLGAARQALGEDHMVQRNLVRLLVRHSLPTAGTAAGLLPPSFRSTDSSSGGSGGSGGGGTSSGGGASGASAGSQVPPAVQGGVAWSFLECCYIPLAHRCLAAALAEHVHSAEGPAFVRLMVGLLQGALQEPPPDVEEGCLLGVQEMLPHLLARAAPALSACECCRHRLGSQLHREQVQEGAWRVLGLVPTAAGVLRRRAEAPLPGYLLRAAAQASSSAAQEEATARHYHSGVLLSLCHWWMRALQPATFVDSVRSACQVEAWAEAAEAGLRLLPLLLELALMPPPLLPGLAGPGAGADLPRHPPGDAADLAAVLFSVFDEVGATVLYFVVRQAHEHYNREVSEALTGRQVAHPQEAPPDLPALVPPLFRLHCAASRLVHWAAALGSEGQRRLAGMALTWRRMLLGSSYVVHALGACLGSIAVFRAPTVAPHLADAERMLRSASAAQVEVLAAVASRLPPAELASALDPNLHVIRHYAEALTAAPQACLTAEAVAALCALLQQAMQLPPPACTKEAELRAASILKVSFCCNESARLTAALVAHPQGMPLLQGAFKHALACLVARMPSGGGGGGLGHQQPVFGGMADGVRTLRTARQFYNELVSGLKAAIRQGCSLQASSTADPSSSGTGGSGSSAGSSSAGSSNGGGDGGSGSSCAAGGSGSAGANGAGSSTEAGADLRQAAAELARLERRFADELGRSTNIAVTLEQQVQRLLPLAAAAAAALHEHAGQPGVAAAARLELAQAAAARPCAALRCASLGSASSKRCSQCKAVRYCSTACSHADWARGHRRVCRELAAERQEQRQAAAAAVAALDGTD